MLFFNKSINIIVRSNCPVNGIYIWNKFLMNYKILYKNKFGERTVSGY